MPEDWPMIGTGGYKNQVHFSLEKVHIIQLLKHLSNTARSHSCPPLLKLSVVYKKTLERSKLISQKGNIILFLAKNSSNESISSPSSLELHVNHVESVFTFSNCWVPAMLQDQFPIIYCLWNSFPHPNKFSRNWHLPSSIEIFISFPWLTV